ncbi:glycosyltransferase family 9 protein [Selenomonas sp. AB3002]|uniref:glycosyltransferase family 9 protein n=1 Tax=Selenomonas sp. AB3002 TaxID=1392502 RepID=UPI00049616E3
MTEVQKIVYEGLMGFYESHKGGPFLGSQLVEYMEPIFKRAGLREETAVSGQHILVVRDDAAGDFVLFSPFMRELRRIYPGAHITLFASDRNAELARCCPYIDNILIKNFERDSGSFWEIYPMLARHAVEQFVPYHFDLAFAGRLGLKSASVLLMYMGGAKRRVTYTQNRPKADGTMVDVGWDDLISIPVPILNKLESDVDRDLYILEYILQLPIADRHLELWTLASDREAARQAVEPLLGKKNIKRLYTVMPCTSEAFRQWPVERFIEMLKVIMKREKDLGLVLMGGKGDAPRTETVAKAFPGRALSLAGKLPFRVSAEVVGLTEKYIGDDTALMHIAAAKKVPVLTTFPYPAELGLRPMSVPIRFQPYQVPSVILLPPKAAGDKCRLSHGTGCSVAAGPHCILGITVEKMLDGYKRLNKCIEEGRTASLVLK